MSVDGFRPIPVDRFGGLVTLVDAADLPVGLSPDCRDVEFAPGLVRTRPGLSLVFTIAQVASINGLRTYTTITPSQLLLVLTNAGAVYVENPFGTLTLLRTDPLSTVEQSGTGVGAYTATTHALRLASATLFGREFICVSDGKKGVRAPMYYDGAAVRRISSQGPGEAPAYAENATAGSVVAGVHKGVVIFEMPNGYRTAPSPFGQWTAAGSKTVDVTAIPLGPSGTRKRILAFTAAGGGEYYFIPNSRMVIQDNTTTSVAALDFSDTNLLAGENVDKLFKRIELPYVAGVVAYADRLLFWGERARISEFVNMDFSGGFTSGGRPLGWTEISAGESQEISDFIFVSALKLTTGPSLPDIRQAANKLIDVNTKYHARVRVKGSTDLNLNTNAQLRLGFIGTGVDVSAIVADQTTSSVLYQTYDVAIPQISGAIPSDLNLRLFVTAGSSNVGYFLVDDVEIYRDDTPHNLSLVRASRVSDPEAFDGVDGLMQIAPDNGQAIRAAFVLRGFLYFAKERSLYVTADDGANEPSKWSVREVSNRIGCVSIQGLASGEDWVVMAARDGLYLFAGGEPVKLSQEIQPTWDGINWNFSETIQVRVDTEKKRIYILAPFGASTQPDRVLVLDYTEGFGNPLGGKGGRAWCPWFIPANSIGLIERSTGTARVFFGSNAAGKIYELLTSQLSDDGAAINSYYQTAYLSSSRSIGRQLFGYLTGLVKGVGSLQVTAYRPGGVNSVSLAAWTLTDPETKDLERLLNLKDERRSFRTGTNAAGSWFSLRKLVAWARPDPWAVVRGRN